MAISAVLMRRLNESLSSKTGNSTLPRGTSTPFSDFISTATVSEKRNVTLLICVWTVPSCLSLVGEFWLATIPGSAAQRRTNRARDIKSGIDMWNGETKVLTNCNIAPLADLNRSFRFGPLACASYASPVLDTTNLPPGQAPARSAGFGRVSRPKYYPGRESCASNRSSRLRVCGIDSLGSGNSLADGYDSRPGVGRLAESPYSTALSADSAVRS